MIKIQAAILEPTEKRPHYKELSEFYKDDGFDFHDYVRSDIFAQRRHFAMQKLRDTVVDNVNETIEAAVGRLIDSQEFSRVNITEDALKKIDCITDVFQELTDKAGIGTQEVGFFLMSGGKQQGISDVHIPNSQVVTPAHCDIDGASRAQATRYARREGIGLMSWGHSHGTIDTFLSGEDKKTIKTELPNFANVIQIKVGEDLPYRIKVSPTIVVNVRGDRFGAVQYHYNKIRSTKLGTPLQVSEITILDEGKRHEGIGLEIIRTGKGIKIDREKIKHQLLHGYNKDGGVIIDSEWGKMRLNDMLEAEPYIAKAEIPDISKKVQSLDLKRAEQRYKLLESEYLSLQRDHTGLQETLRLLRDSYEKTNRRVQELTAVQSPSYSQKLESYYTSLLRSRRKEKKYFGIFTKILSGNYRGNIKDIRAGSFTENPEAKRIWKWEDRLRALKNLYSYGKVEFAELGLQYVDKLRGILGENRYLKRYYRKQVDKLLNRFYR